MGTAITVKTNVNTSIEKAWETWTKPEHVVNWNNASEDWHTPSAKNDLKVGGEFCYTMAAKDGSVSFDFKGIYTVVDAYKRIAYTLEDNRKVDILFENDNNQTIITETFEAETMNSIELQQMGWQAILDNYKHYTEKQ